MGWRLDDLPEALKARVSAQLAEDDAARARAALPQGELRLPGVTVANEPPEPENRAVARAEVKELHAPFRQWLGLHRLPHVYARPDRASSIRTGWPDFTIFDGGKAVAVEFKWRGQKLRPEQAEVRREIEQAGIPYLCAYSVAEGIAFVRERLGMEALAEG